MTAGPDMVERADGAARLDEILDRISTDPEGVTAWTARDPQEAGRWFLERTAGASAAPGAVIDAASLGVAAVDGDGRVIAETALFAVNGGGDLIDWEAVRAARQGDQPVVRAASMGPDETLQPVLIAYGNRRAAASWQLPDAVRAPVEAGLAVAVIASFAPPEGSLRRAAAAYALTGLQERVCSAIIATGDIRSAAAACGISYATAREAASGAMARMGVGKLPELVTRLTEVAYGLLPDPGREALLIDMWGLTLRQATLAHLVAGGRTRDEAARAMAISPAVAKKEMDAIFRALDVGTAAELARSLAGMGAVAAMLRATGGSVGSLDPAFEPLRFALRPDGSRIAYSDYGPAGGRPVLVVHSSMTTRIVARNLVRALQARGFRPVSIDRPGFGLSDLREGDGRGPFEQAADDLAIVTERLGVTRWDVVARGGAQAVHAAARAYPALFDRVVLVNPDPQTDAEGRRSGPLGFFKELYWRNPALIRAGARVLANQLTRERLASILARSVKGSPPDEEAVANPALIDDYHRSVRAFATGRIEGYVAEQQWFVTGRPPEPFPGTHRWHLLIGAHDTLHDPDLVARYWVRVLPDAAVTIVPGQGRMLALAVPELVVEVLAKAD